MQQQRVRWMWVASALTLACGSDDEGTVGTGVEDPMSMPSEGSETMLEGFSPLAPREGETHLVTPIIEGIESGADVNYCTYLPVTADSDVNVVRAVGEQSREAGHHALLYVATTPQEPGTHRCTEADMMNSNYVAAAGGGVRTDNHIPEGVGYFVPAGSQFFVQSHWINTSSETASGQTAFNIEMQPISDEVQSAALVNIAGLAIDIPPSATGYAETTCTLDRELKVFSYGGHAHEWGTNVKVTWTPAGGEPTVIYDEPWEPEFASDAPLELFAAEEAFVFSAGDQIHVECEYDNTTDAALQFPAEMCIWFAYYFPGTEGLNCIDGLWISDDAAASLAQ